MMNLDEFRTALKAMAALDRRDLEAFGLFASGSDNWKYASGSVDYEWNRFNDDPCSYLIAASNEDAELIFMAIMSKMFRKV